MSYLAFVLVSRLVAFSPQLELLPAALWAALLLLLVKLQYSYTNYLTILLLLEFLFLTSLVALVLSPFGARAANLLLLMIFVLAVGEARLGLGALVLISRAQGKDLLSLVD